MPDKYFQLVLTPAVQHAQDQYFGKHQIAEDARSLTPARRAVLARVALRTKVGFCSTRLATFWSDLRSWSRKLLMTSRMFRVGSIGTAFLRLGVAEVSP